jgi:hypothetical protein
MQLLMSSTRASPDDEIALLVRKSRAFHKFHKERRRSPMGCFECDDTTHFIADCLKRKKLDSNKYNCIKRNDYNKGNDKKFKKIMSQACAVLSDIDFSNDDSSNSEEHREGQAQARRLHRPLPHGQVFEKHL